MKSATARGFLLMIVGVMPSLSVAKPPTGPQTPAPSYYIAVEARTCVPDSISFHGASNLPPGSLLRLSIKDFFQDSWKDYSHELNVPVNDNGSFEGKVVPKDGAKFSRNLLVHVVFTPFSPKQADKVITILGKKGENLGGLDNPQVGQLSGNTYYLESIARVPYCGEK